MDYQVIITRRVSKDLETIYSYIESEATTVQAQKFFEQLCSMINSLEYLQKDLDMCIFHA